MSAQSREPPFNVLGDQVYIIVISTQTEECVQTVHSKKSAAAPGWKKQKRDELEERLMYNE